MPIHKLVIPSIYVYNQKFKYPLPFLASTEMTN